MTGVGLKGSLFPACSHIPQPCGIIPAPSGQYLTVWGERYGTDSILMLKGKQITVAELPEVVPFKAAEVFLARSGLLTFQQLQHSSDIHILPCRISQVHL